MEFNHQSCFAGQRRRTGKKFLNIGLFVLFLLLSFSMNAQNAVFLHHSTGEGVWNGGNGDDIPALLAAYNTANGTAYGITERAYPTGSYPWENYPYDYWNLWLNGVCSQSELSTQCLGNIADDYDLIIFKHCFPGAGIQPDQGDPDITSSTKTLANYKAQYRALRTLMDGYTDTKFMVWTLAPLHRLATTPEQAARAREFVNWVKNDWLTEDGKAHPNIYIFDFYGYVAEGSASPENGQTNCLKYDYEKSHEGSDSHPNDAANTVMAPIFFQAIIDAFHSTGSGIAESLVSGNWLYPNPASGQFTFSFPERVSDLTLVSLSGQVVRRLEVDAMCGQVVCSGLAPGLYLVLGQGEKRCYTDKLTVQ